MFSQKSLILETFRRNSFLEFNLQQSQFPCQSHLGKFAALHPTRGGHVQAEHNNPLCGFQYPSLVFLYITEVNMTQNERERLEKAHHTAQLLLADVRAICSKTDSIAVEELMLTTIEQVANISRLLGRLASQQ